MKAIGYQHSLPIEQQGSLVDTKVRMRAEPETGQYKILGWDAVGEVLAPQGKLAMIDDPKEPLDIMKLKMKSISLHWELMFTRSMFATWDMQKQHDLLNRVAGLIDSGAIKTTLGENYGRINAANLKRAQAHIESNQAVGKLVLEGF